MESIYIFLSQHTYISFIQTHSHTRICNDIYFFIKAKRDALECLGNVGVGEVDALLVQHVARLVLCCLGRVWMGRDGKGMGGGKYVYVYVLYTEGESVRARGDSHAHTPMYIYNIIHTYLEQPHENQRGEEGVDDKDARKAMLRERSHGAKVEPEGDGLEESEEKGHLGPEGPVDEA